MNPVELVAPATVITLAMGVIQILKTADSEKVFTRFYPLVSFIVGLALGYLFELPTLTLITTALAVAGTYDNISKTILGKISK